MEMQSNTVPVFGKQLKNWRKQRRISQLDFALDAEISQKHLSFIETGRATPSREMVVRLSECLDVPLRERNALLLAAGYAPLYPMRDLEDKTLKPARDAIELLLKGHEPYPALAVDRHWNMLANNNAVLSLLCAVSDQTLLHPPVNILRIALHPKGLAPRIINLAQLSKHLLERLKHQIEVTHAPELVKLYDELSAYPCPEYNPELDSEVAEGVLVPLRLAMPFGHLSFFSTTTVFGTPVDITLSEIAIESFFPADEETRRLLQSG